jgi:hypothetical protein
MTMPPDETPYFGEEVADAIQEQGAAGVPVRQRARDSRTVGGGNAERYFPARTRQEAQAALDGIKEFCRTCPERYSCPEDECAVYRQEKVALAVKFGRDDGGVS